jgi:capsular polysaccharide transport system ATP-binding protein
MICFKDVSKTYTMRNLRKQVFSNLNFTVERGDSIGICGANGVGKSTLMRLLAGVEHPTTGAIHRNMTTSWPIGYSSAFQPALTGADNVRFIARIYGQDADEMLDYVEDFAQLGPYLKQPVKTYSAGMNARLAFALSMAISFDCYLIDEVTGAGDSRFRKRSKDELAARSKNSTLIMVSHDPHTLQEYCTRGAVLYGGNLTFFDSVAEACHVHHGLQMRGF